MTNPSRKTATGVFVIAEAGVNHNGSIELAHRLVEAAADAGVDAVKFQTFRAEALVTRDAAKAGYQAASGPEGQSQYEMLRALELRVQDYRELADRAARRGVAFLSTPFDAASLRFLVAELGMGTVKVSSGDLTNAPFLVEIARVAERVILSTGMGTLADVERALGALAYGFLTDPEGSPGVEAFERAYVSDRGQSVLRGRVTLLHCTTEYPTPPEEVNLRAIATLERAFGLEVGYSDHTAGSEITIAAAALGARVIEKHFTLDRALPGPDHAASLEPDELARMVSGIRAVEAALGDGVKRPFASELANRAAARKSLVAARDIALGDHLQVTTKRPGTGLSPFMAWMAQSWRATRAYRKDELIDG